MCSKNSAQFLKKDLVGFTLPKLHKSKQWYVDFFAYDPTVDGMKRKKIMLNKYGSARQKEDAAAIIIHNIYHKLIAGWNPFVNARKTRQYTEFSKVTAKYLQYLTASENKGVMKKKTVTDYRSRLRQLELFVSESSVNIKYVYQFDRPFVVDFLDYLILDKDVTAKTRNNYRTWLSAFASWMIERQYIEENPVEGVHLLREDAKTRDALAAADLERLSQYLSSHNPPYRLACLMEYYTFIRPDELRYIKVGDISIEQQNVYISGEVAKNRKGQYVALNDAVLKEMISQGVFEHRSDEYLFGYDLLPGEKQVYVNRFRQEWVKVRAALGFPDTYQFYSLKDSGIRDLANEQGIVVARDQARHHDVAVTNKYLKDSGAVHESAKHFKGRM